MRIAHILGDWSRNIGNAFFQLGGQYALQASNPNAELLLIGEQPGYPSYWNYKGGNPKTAFNISKYLDADYLVLMGPIFRRETEKIWGPTLKRILANGTRLILLGIGAMSYQPNEIKQYREFLGRYRPYLITSRDSVTFQNLGDLAEDAHDGIDLGFFVPEIYAPKAKLRCGHELLALNFDMIPEPRIRIHEQPLAEFTPKNNYDRVFNLNGQTWQLEFPTLRTELATRSRMTLFLEGVLFAGNTVDEIGSYEIIRTDHRVHPMSRKKSYRYPNVLINDTPYPYLHCYQSAALTLSSRVHACVAALAYGNSAMLFSSSPRSMLLEKAGAVEITHHPIKLDLTGLAQKKAELIRFLADKIK